MVDLIKVSVAFDNAQDGRTASHVQNLMKGFSQTQLISAADGYSQTLTGEIKPGDQPYFQAAFQEYNDRFCGGVLSCRVG